NIPRRAWNEQYAYLNGLAFKPFDYTIKQTAIGSALGALVHVRQFLGPVDIWRNDQLIGRLTTRSRFSG
ncbi:MAG TPA: hypothetical protein P5526_30025, partial [Anaerolineae bacterium]|nr:hypothetical protein [Anaerolineae bacterium]